MSDNSRVRVSIVGVVVVALFARSLARLWFLQMGAEEQLRFQAVARSTAHRSRPNRRAARSSTATARCSSRTSRRGRSRSTAQLAEDDARPACSASSPRCSRRSTRPSSSSSNFNDLRQSPLKPAIVALDVPEPARLAILEHIEDYPGRDVEKLTVPHYPHGELAAHVLGYVGEISDAQLASRAATRATKPATTIGRDGVEARVRVGAARQAAPRDGRGRPDRPAGRRAARRRAGHGRRQREAHDRREAGRSRPRPRSRRASRPRATQQNANVKEQALRDAEGTGRRGRRARRAPTARSSRWRATRRTRQSGSSAASARPTTTALTDNPRPPAARTGRRRASTRRARRSSSSASLAMTQYGDPRRRRHGHRQGLGQARQGQARVQQRRQARARARSTCRARSPSRATCTSTRSATTFWQTWNDGDKERGLGIQTTARELGFGATTGIELDEADGHGPRSRRGRRRSPTANYKTAQQKQRERRVVPGRRHLQPRSARATSSSTPLQLANAYAAFANGGTLWKPHIGARRDRPERQRRADATRRRRSGTITIDPNVRAAMLAGLRRRRSPTRRAPRTPRSRASRSTRSRSRARPAPRRSACRKGKGDTSLFAANFPADAPRSTWSSRSSKQAGFGAQTAAPIVRRVIEAIERHPPTPTGARARDGQRLMAAITAGRSPSRRRRSAATPARCAHVDLAAARAAVRDQRARVC